MSEFKSLGAFANHLGTLTIEPFIRDALEQIGQRVEATAKAEFGIYQPEVGDFEAWKELADATKADRVHQGYPEDTPLLRSGETRDSISHMVSTEGLTTPSVQVIESEVAIGSTSDIMLYQELGTPTIPPRPVLGPALLQNDHFVKEILGRAAAAGILPLNERSALYRRQIT